MDGLATYRARIDEIDKQLIALYEARMDVCLMVAEYKRAHDMPVLQPERERAVLARAASRVTNPTYAPGAHMLFESLMRASRALQREALHEGEPPAPMLRPVNPLVAYPGAPGAFSEQAALDYFGEDARTVAYERFEDVAAALKRGDVDCAVLPVENSTAGSVDESYRVIAQYGLNIAGEQVAQVRHHLLGVPGAELLGVREIRSHPQAIAQCHAFLLTLDGVRIVPCENTALAARAVRDAGDASIAAIASTNAMHLYGLNVLRDDIQDAQRNYTRFAVLTREPVDTPDADKATVVFTLTHHVGTLARVIDDFAREGINMCRLESRPRPEAPWRYTFYADLEWPSGRSALLKALEAAQHDAESLRLLGLYKKAGEAAPC